MASKSTGGGKLKRAPPCDEGPDDVAAVVVVPPVVEDDEELLPAIQGSGGDSDELSLRPRSTVGICGDRSSRRTTRMRVQGWW